MSFKKIFHKINQVSGTVALVLVLAVLLMAAGQGSNFARIVLGTANYGTDPNTTADITFQNDEYISNATDGTLDFGAATISTTGNFDITGDYVFENDEQIVNSTDGDIEFVYNDSAACLGQLFLKSSIDTSDVVDNMYMEIRATWYDDSLGYTDYGAIRFFSTDVTDAGTTEDGYIQLRTMVAGTEKVAATFGNGGTTYFGAFGAAQDIIWHSSTAGDSIIFDASEECLTIIGTNAQDALNVDDGNVDIADNVDIDGILETDQLTINSTEAVTAIDTFCTVTGAVRWVKVTVAGVTFWASADTATVK